MTINLFLPLCFHQMSSDPGSEEECPAPVSPPTIASRQTPARPSAPPPPLVAMTPWLGEASSASMAPTGWQPPGAHGGHTFQPWLSSGEDKHRPASTLTSSSSPSSFTRPGLSSSSQGVARDYLSQQQHRPLPPSYPHPHYLQQAHTQITHSTPAPGEVTIDKVEPWTPAPAPAAVSSRPQPPAATSTLTSRFDTLPVLNFSTNLK